MNATIIQSLAPWDGQWHHVQVPLRSFVDGGSWDNAWFPPPGHFDWSAVDSFQIVSEYHDFVGMQFWFDDIRITNPAGPRKRVCEKQASSGWQPQGRRPWGWLTLIPGRSPFAERAIPKLRSGGIGVRPRIKR